PRVRVRTKWWELGTGAQKKKEKRRPISLSQDAARASGALKLIVLETGLVHFIITAKDRSVKKRARELFASPPTAGASLHIRGVPPPPLHSKIPRFLSSESAQRCHTALGRGG